MNNKQIKLQLPSTIPSQASTIPAFLLKLRNLLDDQSNDDLICWNPVNDGESFLLFDQTRFAKEVLPQYFKHNNLASFIRQLNMYGFKKITSIEHGGLTAKDDMEFFNQYFLRDEPGLMERIKRKGSVIRDKFSEYGTLQPAQVPDVLVEIKDLKETQDSYSTQLEVLKKENSRLWQDVANLRFQHVQQQKIINKLLQFMATVATKCRTKGKRKLPMLPLGPSSKKIAHSSNLSNSGNASSLQDDSDLASSGYSIGPNTNQSMIISDITGNIGDDTDCPCEGPEEIIPSTVSAVGSDDIDVQFPAATVSLAANETSGNAHHSSPVSKAIVTLPDSPNPKTFKAQFSDNLQDVQGNLDLLRDIFAHSDALELPTAELDQIFDGGNSSDVTYALPSGSTPVDASLNDLMTPASMHDLDPPTYYDTPGDLDVLMNEFAGASQGSDGLSALDDLIYPLNDKNNDEDTNRPVISSHELD